LVGADEELVGVRRNRVSRGHESRPNRRRSIPGYHPGLTDQLLLQSCRNHLCVSGRKLDRDDQDFRRAQRLASPTSPRVRPDQPTLGDSSVLNQCSAESKTGQQSGELLRDLFSDRRRFRPRPLRSVRAGKTDQLLLYLFDSTSDLRGLESGARRSGL